MKRLLSKLIPVLILTCILAASCTGTQTTLQPTTPAAALPTASGSVEPDPPLSATLDFDTFLEDSFRELMLRDPERVLRDGLTEVYGVESVELTNISDAYIRETQQIQAAFLATLRSYNRDDLTPEQQTSYDIYEWYLDDLVRRQAFMYYNYPVAHFTIGVQQQLTQFFTDIHPLTSLQDAEDYVTRLSQVETKFEQLIEGLRLREEAGVIPPRFIIQWTLPEVRRVATARATDTPFYTAFAEKVDALADISATDRQALLDAAAEAIDGAVIPAFQALVEHLEQLESIAPTDDGVWQFPDGGEYYEYILRRYTTTTMTADEIHELGLQGLEDIHAEMRAIFDELGYPEDESLPSLFDRVSQDGGTVPGSQAAETYETIIETAEQDLDAVFDLHPTADVIVIAGPTGDYYIPPSEDGARPGAFYANVSGAQPRFGMPTLAYHEAVPGHHFQIAIAQELDLPSFRNRVRFTAYTEGWALYAERLAWELGWYEDDPYGNLGRLQAEAFRAARLVVDTGIHALGWTFDEAADYMRENTGLSPGMIRFEISRYIAWPGQATAYKVGMLKILELRQMAIDQLGNEFDLTEFHNVVLGNGSMPLNVLEQVVQTYVDGKLSQETPAGDGIVEGWAVLAEKDDYSDVDMTALPVGYIGITQMRQVLEDAGWDPGQIQDLFEFDRDSLQGSLDWLAENADQDDIVLLFVAGHGLYLRDILDWDSFFAAEWEEVPSHRRLLIVDSCQAANYTRAVADDPAPHLTVAAVDGNEYGWSGLEEEGLPIIGGVFTHFFAAAFADPSADTDDDGLVSAQEAARWAEGQQRTYMHEVVFSVPEFLEMYHVIGSFPEEDPGFPHVIMHDTVGEPLYLNLGAYR